MNEKELLELMKNDPKRFEWQQVRTESGNVMIVLCDLSKNNKGEEIKKPFVKTENKTNGTVSTEYFKKDELKVVQK
jgi:hypothetical protein